MRYDTPVTFILEKEEYNENTGNTEPTITDQMTILANVSDTAEERANLFYGKINIPAYTVILKGSVPFLPSYLMIGGKKYTADKIRRLRLTTTLFVSG